ncbi:MAG: hypothetical protein D6770_03775 [Anaerolineae bacterium]|nr:MAG: hypothetical protein D6770_03775 [Anaerolineae bacterium]
MFILLPIVLLTLTALALLLLRGIRPVFRFPWLVAAGGVLVTWLSILLWHSRIPITLRLPLWRPVSLFPDSPTFLVDAVSWPYAISLATLLLGVILTAVARGNFPHPLAWAGAIMLSTLGLLAVLADNPVTLVLAWAALDLVELVTVLRSVDEPHLSENAVTAFAAKALGIVALLWANVVNIASGAPPAFHSMTSKAGIYLLLAAGLRLGVLPLHLPYTPESALRRGFGTTLRLVSAASSLILLARISPESLLLTPLNPLLIALVTLAALYGGWNWLRAPNELIGRPYLMISTAALATIAALGGSPLGAIGWGCALLLSGGALFLHSSQHPLPRYSLLIGGIWGLSALPFSPTAAAWQNTTLPFFFWPFLIVVQAFVLAGYLRHVQRARTTFPSSLPPGGQVVYPTGVLLPVILHLSLGLWGWEGARMIGHWWVGLTATLLALGITWPGSRLSFLQPRAHWVRPTNRPWLDGLYRVLGGLYRLIRAIGNLAARVLEGEGGILWTLLFLTLFISLLSRGGQ